MNFSKFTKHLINITLVFLILFLFSRVTDFIKPVTTVFIFLLAPIIIATYIYYALRPLKMIILRLTKNQTISSVITFLAFIIIFILLFSLIGTMLATQLTELITNTDFSNILESNRGLIRYIEDNFQVSAIIENIQAQLESYISSIPGNIRSTITGLFSSISSVATQFILLLLAVFYFLKDENEIKNLMKDTFQGQYYDELYSMSTSINETLKTYISGQLLVAVILGGLMFVGFIIIGLPYSFLMAAIALVTNFIPFIGPVLGALPAALIALTVEFSMAIKVVVLTIVVQQLESNIITPNIIGSKVDLHPFVVMVNVLIFMNLFGVIGALVSTPVFLSIVILIKGIYRIIKKRRFLELNKDSVSIIKE